MRLNVGRDLACSLSLWRTIHFTDVGLVKRLGFRDFNLSDYYRNSSNIGFQEISRDFWKSIWLSGML